MTQISLLELSLVKRVSNRWGNIHKIRNAYSCDDGRRGSRIFFQGVGGSDDLGTVLFFLKKDKIDGIYLDMFVGCVLFALTRKE